MPSTYSFSATTSYENVLSKPFQSLFEKAKLGDSKAQYELGLSYFYGWGVKQNYTEAFKWFREAAEVGFAKAMFYLGTLYENGRGVKQSYTEAVKWFREAAEKGHEAAQYRLGLAYVLGRGVKESDSEAVKWFSLDFANPPTGGFAKSRLARSGQRRVLLCADG